MVYRAAEFPIRYGHVTCFFIRGVVYSQVYEEYEAMFGLLVS